MAEVQPQTVEEPASTRLARLRTLFRPLANRNFRLLWIGESVSLLGDQFYLLALPWLMLELTGSGLALGAVLMVAAVPRLLFMLVGGALTDRFSPRTLMLISNGVRTLLAGALAALLVTNTLTVWLVYVLSFGFGMIDAFFYPAVLAIVPHLVEQDELAPSNALLQTTGTFTSVIGPALAGVLVAAGGTATAFAIDAATFLFATLMLLVMRVRPETPSVAEHEETRESENLLGSVAAGLRSIWADPSMRVFLILIFVINFLLSGPAAVGVPALVALRFGGNATAFGGMMSTYGVGALLGTLAAGAMARPRRMGIALLSCVAVVGLVLAGIGVAPNVVVAAALLGGIGVGTAYINVHIISWLQQRSAPELLGRVMSVVMLAVFGLDPLSRVVSGALIDISTVGLFVGAGLLMMLIALIAALFRSAREIA